MEKEKTQRCEEGNVIFESESVSNDEERYRDIELQEEEEENLENELFIMQLSRENHLLRLKLKSLEKKLKDTELKLASAEEEVDKLLGLTGIQTAKLIPIEDIQKEFDEITWKESLFWFL